MARLNLLKIVSTVTQFIVKNGTVLNQGIYLDESLKRNLLSFTKKYHSTAIIYFYFIFFVPRKL